MCGGSVCPKSAPVCCELGESPECIADGDPCVAPTTTPAPTTTTTTTPAPTTTTTTTPEPTTAETTTVTTTTTTTTLETTVTTTTTTEPTPKPEETVSTKLTDPFTQKANEEFDPVNVFETGNMLLLLLNTNLP